MTHHAGATPLLQMTEEEKLAGNPGQLPPPPAGRTGWPWRGPVHCLPEVMPNGKTWPRITIVTPNYNYAGFLEETMRSVLMQGYPNLEYMVIDDGSSDGSEEVIRRYEPHLAFWTKQKNAGQPVAINNGMARASGEILAWINSDDLLLPRALERTALARMKPDVKITCGFREVIDFESRVLWHWVHPRPNNEDLKRICYVGQETVFWNREVWEKAGPLGANWRFALDFDLWQKFMAAGFTFHLVPYFIGAFRIHAASKGETMHSVREVELSEIYRKYLGREVCERELEAEARYGKRMRLIKRLAKTKVFHWPWMAQRLVDWAYLPHSLP